MNNDMTTVQKAAILMTSLDRETARALFGQLDSPQQQQLQSAMSELGAVAPDVRQAVIDEFYRIGPVASRKPADNETGEGPAPGVSLTARKASEKTTGSIRPSAAPSFRCLEETESEGLNDFLQGEHPQTIAVVLSHLPSSRAIDVVSALSSNVQADVLRRLADLDETSPEVLHEIEQGLEAHIAQYTKLQKRRAAGVKAVANILRSADHYTNREIMANLESHSPQLASRLDSPQFTFAQFENLDVETIATVLHAAEVDLMMLALAGASSLFVDQVIAQLPPRESRRFRQAFQRLGPTSLADVEHAQCEIVRIAEQLAAAGRIRLPRAEVLNAVA